MFVAGSDDEATKVHSGMGDDEKVKEGNCRGVLREWVPTTIYESMEGWNEVVEVK